MIKVCRYGPQNKTEETGDEYPAYGASTMLPRGVLSSRQKLLVLTSYDHTDVGRMQRQRSNEVNKNRKDVLQCTKLLLFRFKRKEEYSTMGGGTITLALIVELPEEHMSP